MMSSPPTDAQLNDLLEELPALAGRPRQLAELSGGLTNRNVKITTSDGVYVARCTDAATNMLGIDRDREYHNTKAAAEAGVGAQVIDYRPDLGILLLSYLNGKTLCNDDFQRPGIIVRAAAANVNGSCASRPNRSARTNPAAQKLMSAPAMRRNWEF